MQDSAPVHTSKKTQAYLSENFDEFWSKDKWPPLSPDANSMDYTGCNKKNGHPKKWL